MRRIRQLLVTAFLLFAAISLHAQGTNGLVPDPAHAEELEEIADALALDAEQQAHFSSLKEAYLADAKRLRESRIEAFLIKYQAFGPASVVDALPDPAALDQWIRGRHELVEAVSMLIGGCSMGLQLSLMKRKC
ncbi:MAG: hypothetical protein ACR2GY_08140 [Phycisphaerales bacterium]